MRHDTMPYTGFPTEKNTSTDTRNETQIVNVMTIKAQIARVSMRELIFIGINNSA